MIFSAPTEQDRTQATSREGPVEARNSMSSIAITSGRYRCLFSPPLPRTNPAQPYLSLLLMFCSMELYRWGVQPVRLAAGRATYACLVGCISLVLFCVHWCSMHCRVSNGGTSSGGGGGGKAAPSLEMTRTTSQAVTNKRSTSAAVLSSSSSS